MIFNNIYKLNVTYKYSNMSLRDLLSSRIQMSSRDNILSKNICDENKSDKNIDIIKFNFLEFLIDTFKFTSKKENEIKVLLCTRR